MDVNTYVEKRLKALQKRWNFNPNRGVAQIKKHPDKNALEAFGQFRELRDLVHLPKE
jgi:hypothetical protein